MNPASMMKMMAAKNKFEAAHPKFISFLKYVFSTGIEEGTVIEFTVTKPGQEPVTANLKVTQEDLDLFNELKNLN